MATILLQTKIKASRKVCFDLSRSIDLHATSMAHTGEKPVAGRTSGLMKQGESVTWEATHFMIRQRLSSRITEMVDPEYFIDEMTQGAFKSLWHKHSFIQSGKETLLTDHFRYEVPLGMIGKLFDWLVLRNYMRRILIHRNQVIKKAAETL